MYLVKLVQIGLSGCVCPKRHIVLETSSHCSQINVVLKQDLDAPPLPTINASPDIELLSGFRLRVSYTQSVPQFSIEHYPKVDRITLRLVVHHLDLSLECT